jgi:hypothetical protein
MAATVIAAATITVAAITIRSLPAWSSARWRSPLPLQWAPTTTGCHRAAPS